jgi:hypothetical protein
MNAVVLMKELVVPIWKIIMLVGGIFLVALAVSAAVAFYQSCDQNGQVPHTTTVDVYMKGDWLVGENRECLGVQGAPPPHTNLIGSLFCPADTNVFADSHNISVKFWGRIDRAGTQHRWRCRRESDGFTCWAID